MQVKQAALLRSCSNFVPTLLPQRGETALHMAARSGQAAVVRHLVQDGAQVEAKAKVSAIPGSICY